MRRALLVAGSLLALVCAVAAGPAAAAPRLHACPGDAGFRCGVLPVPLDRTGATPGVVRLHFAAARERRSRVLVALSGGPGQPSVATASSFALSLAPALRRYRLVVLDQRGTGRSGVLRCPNVQGALSLTVLTARATAACAQRLGPRRAFYSTSDTVLDLEALRQALGVDRLALMGVSYGTHVALEYARAFPQHVDRLILDSVVGPDGPDAFLLDSYGRLPRVLREQCARRACRSITPDPVADLATLVRRLGRGPLRGRIFDASGRRRTVSIHDGAALDFFLTAGDLNPALQAAMPAAMASAARRGDLTPLLRLRRVAQGPPLGLGELSWGLNLATGCADARMPFALTTPLAQRPAFVQAALAAVPAGAYAPWDARTVLRTSYAQSCLLWPTDVVRPPATAPLPDVPALLLGGRLDLRTPLENALATARELPRSSVVALPGSGHDVLDSDLTGCSARALGRFAAGRAVGHPCAGKDNGIPPVPLAPRSLQDFRSAPGVGGRRGRVLFAVLDTVSDATLEALQLDGAGLSARGGGLRGGRFAWSGSGPVLRLHRYAYVPGLRITGGVRRGGVGAGSVDVRFAGLSGRLALDGRGGASGVLGGRPVRYRAPRRAARAAVDGSAAAWTRLPDRVEEQLQHDRLSHERGQGRP